MPVARLLEPQRRRRRRAAVLAGALALLILAVWAVQRAAAPAGEVAQAPSVTAASSTAPSSEPTSESPAPSTTRPPSSPTSAATPTTRPPSPSTTAAPSPTTAANGAVTASALSKAVRDYYGLLPDDTDAGWALLTDRYQRTTSRSRDYYDRFWGAISRVQVSDVTSEAPSSVVATLRYDYDDGRSFIERTSYSLVREDGRLKIDRSSVLSSRQV